MEFREVKIGSRVQASGTRDEGFSVNDIDASLDFTPHFEMGGRFEYMVGYGASLGSYKGFGKPVLRARQLIDGKWEHGQWFSLQVGLALFNLTGTTNEVFRYWSERLSFHEPFYWGQWQPFLEAGASVRSLSQPLAPYNVALIFPPSVDGIVGIQRIWPHFSIRAEVRGEQALAKLTEVGPVGSRLEGDFAEAFTIFTGHLGLQANLSDIQSVFFDYAGKIYVWPSSVVPGVRYFDDGVLGPSYKISWGAKW